MLRYFEDFRVGEEFVTPGRTICESDITNFAAVSGDYYSIHTDEIYAKTTAFGGRIAQGALTLSIVTGLWLRLGLYEDAEDKSLIAFYGMDNLRFTAPVRIGDTIHARLKVVEAKDRDKDGLVSLLNEVLNEDGKVVLSFTAHLLFKKANRAKSWAS